MAEKGSASIAEWLDLNFESLSSVDRFNLIKEIFETMTAQDLRAVRDLAEQTRQSKLKDAKAAVLEEMKGKLSALGLTLNDVVPSKRSQKSKSAVQAKYRSPEGETWSGRGHAPLWLRQLELQGRNREEFKVSEG